MSYGIWRKRGKGWCSIEIDTPGCTVEEQVSGMHGIWREKLIASAERHGVIVDGSADKAQVRWEIGQRKNQPQRTIVAFWQGEHQIMIAADDIGSLQVALYESEMQFPNSDPDAEAQYVGFEGAEILRDRGAVSDEHVAHWFSEVARKFDAREMAREKKEARVGELDMAIQVVAAAESEKSIDEIKAERDEALSMSERRLNFIHKMEDVVVKRNELISELYDRIARLRDENEKLKDQ